MFLGGNCDAVIGRLGECPAIMIKGTDKMCLKFTKIFDRFVKDQNGAAPIEIGAGVLAAIAVAIGFVALLETMI